MSGLPVSARGQDGGTAISSPDGEEEASSTGTDQMVLDLMKWQLDTVFADRNSIFDRAAIVLGAIGVAGSVLALVMTGEAGAVRFSRPFFGVFTAGVILLGYAALMSISCVLPRRTLLSELLGPEFLGGQRVLKAELPTARGNVLQRLSVVLDYNRRVLVGRRTRLTHGLIALGFSALFISISLWYSIHVDIG